MNIVNGKKISGEIADWYHLNLYTICHRCKKRKGYEKNGPYSCSTYPNINGIPREIWNTKNAECPYFGQEEFE